MVVSVSVSETKTGSRFHSVWMLSEMSRAVTECVSDPHEMNVTPVEAMVRTCQAQGSDTT